MSSGPFAFHARTLLEAVNRTVPTYPDEGVNAAAVALVAIVREFAETSTDPEAPRFAIEVFLAHVLAPHSPVGRVGIMVGLSEQALRVANAAGDRS